MDRNIYLHFYWFRQVLLDHMGEFEIAGHPEMSREEATERYMFWAIQNRFLHTFGNPDPVAGIVLRPVNSEQLERIKTDYYGSLTEFDIAADTVFIDFMYAPGNYPFMIDFVSKCGYPLMAWTNARRGGFHVVPIERMSRTHPFESNGSETALEPLTYC
jgi:hypothetical protein